MHLSIVSTLYKSEPYLREFCARCKTTLESITSEYEIVLVNDGSPDHALHLGQLLAIEDKRIKLVNLSRNFGHQPALRAGLAHAKGDWIFMIDSDLEESPEWLTDFWLQKESYDVIYGIQSDRKGGTFERVSGALYYSLLNFLSPIYLPPNPVTARLMSKEYVQAIGRYAETDTELWMLFAHVGFKQKPVSVEKGHKGVTTYTLRKKIRLALATVTALSNSPLYALLPLSIGMWLISLFCLTVFFYKHNHDGFLMAFIWLGVSTVCLFIGVAAVYLAKILNEVRRRPLVIEKDQNESRT